MAAYIPNIEQLVGAGIDPRTRLPIKFAGMSPAELKNAIRSVLRVKDEQQAVRRYKWFNLPDGLDEIIERVLFYRGQGAFFYMKETNTFYFLPYALCSHDGETGIDVYGRYTSITPLPFTGTTQMDPKKQNPWITGLIKDCVYNPIIHAMVDEAGAVNVMPPTLDEFNNSCVLLSDYTKQISQTTIPRQALNEPILDVMSEMIPFQRTALQNMTGTAGMRVNNQDEYSNVAAANDSVKQAALVGEKYIPIVGNVDFQELTTGTVGNTADFMQALESLDNFRLSLYGIQNAGVYQKTTYTNDQTQALTAGTNMDLVYQDGLTLRQNFCDIVNSIWGLGIACEPSESVMGDTNGDAMPIDDQDQSGSAEGSQDSSMSGGDI